MQTIPEQISSAGRAQLQAQLALFSSIAVATVENTGRLALFQLDAGREAMDRSCAAWSQMLSAGPQNLLEAFARAQSSFAGMLDTARAPFAHAAPERATAEEDGDADRAAEVAQLADFAPHAPQPPLPRTALAEAASEVVPNGQSGIALSAAPTQADVHVTLPRVQPLEASPPPAHSEGVTKRKGLPRK